MTDYLNQAYAKYGFYITKNKYYLCYDPIKMKTVFDCFRDGGKYKSCLGEFKIKNIRDLTLGYDDREESKVPKLPVSGSTQMITIFFENGAIATLRGSGTEPKLKYYIELAGKSREETQGTLDKVHLAIVNEFLQPSNFGLIAPSSD